MFQVVILGNGGNGSDGCASTGADVVPFNQSINSTYTMTLGSENMSTATGNVVLRVDPTIAEIFY